MTPPDLSDAPPSLAAIVRAVADAKLPPVERWNPAHCGHSAMRIAADGTWYHEGAPILRAPLVKLFAGILRREADGRHVLVTPAEKLDIDVDDAPFVAVALTTDGAGRGRTLAFTTNVGDHVVVDAAHPLRVGAGAEPHPVVEVRRGLDALIARPVWYELAALALAEGAEPPGLWSGGVFFPLSPA